MSAWSFTSNPNPLDLCQAVIAQSVVLSVLRWYAFLAHTMKYCTKIGETYAWEFCSSGNARSLLIPESRAKRMNLLRPCWYVTWELTWTALAEWSSSCSVSPSIRGLAGNSTSRQRQLPHFKTPPRKLCSGTPIQPLWNAVVHRDRNVASRPHSWHLVVGPAISFNLPQFSCKQTAVTVPCQSWTCTETIFYTQACNLTTMTGISCVRCFVKRKSILSSNSFKIGQKIQQDKCAVPWNVCSSWQSDICTTQYEGSHGAQL